MKLTPYGRSLLNLLLDKYENSKTYSGENQVNQRFCVAPTDIYRDYESNYESIDRVNAFEDDMRKLEKAGFISISVKRGVMKRLTLNIEAAQEIYHLLGREEKRSIRMNEEYFFRSQMGMSGLIDDFCQDQLDRLAEGKKPQYELEDARIIVRLLKRILANKKELLERELSITFFGDSKTFEKSYRSRVCRILEKYGAFADRLLDIDNRREREMVILEEYHIYANPSYIYFKGNGSLTFEDGSAMLLMRDKPIALSSEALHQVRSIDVEDSKLMTVENLTTYNRMTGEDTFFLYLSGYHNTEKQHLLMRIFECNKRKQLEYCHFGDIDPDGFLILEHLRRETGIDFQPYCMGITELKTYAKYTKRLNQNDTTKAQNMIEKGLHTPVMQYMLDHNMKLEQEIISLYS